MTRTSKGLNSYIRSLDPKDLLPPTEEFADLLAQFTKPQFPCSALACGEKGWIMVHWDKDGKITGDPDVQ